MVVHERLEFADDLFLDALQNYNKKMTYASTHVIFLRICPMQLELLD